ncbi:hypothetical protein Trydic_g16808 [Trypoxylus dichotomus]
MFDYHHQGDLLDLEHLEAASTAIIVIIDVCLSFGLTWIGYENCPLPKCVVCGTTLVSQSMLPNKVKRYLVQSPSACCPEIVRILSATFV